MTVRELPRRARRIERPRVLSQVAARCSLLIMHAERECVCDAP